MFDVVLYQPEIPQNTGNVMRLAANTGCRLHLVRPLGFTLSDKTLKRAGMDYREIANVSCHESWSECLRALANRRFFALTTRAVRSHTHAEFQANDVFVFGPETRGLPKELLESFPQENRLRVPMRAGSRSLNLANTVGIVVYEAWRQCEFEGAST